MALEIEVPAVELVDVEKLRVDEKNPNRMGTRRFEALKKSIKRWGFVIPIITNRDLLVAATTHDDLVEDFQPDILVDKGFESDIRVERLEFKPKQCSIFEHVQIEKGGLEDYEKFSRFHYRSREKGPATNLRMKDCYKLILGDDLIGVIVYSYSFLNLKPRNMVFGDRYVCTAGDIHRARLINEEIVRISRVVIHPKFRGIGLGAYLVRETMPKVDAKVIEVLAVMAKYNPIFQQAGMQRVDYVRDESNEEKRLREFLAARNFDFCLSKSESYCERFFGQLTEGDKEFLVNVLSKYAREPFVKVEKVTPNLLKRLFSSEGVYLYWINRACILTEPRRPS